MTVGQKTTRDKLQENGWSRKEFDPICEIWIKGRSYLYFDVTRGIIKRIDSV